MSLMVKQAKSRMNQHDVVLIASTNYVLIASRASGTRDVLRAELSSAVDVVAEGEEGVRRDRHVVQLVQPFSAFLLEENMLVVAVSELHNAYGSERLDGLGEVVAPLFVGNLGPQDAGDQNIDGVRLFSTANVRLPWQVQHPRVLAQPPETRSRRNSLFSLVGYNASNGNLLLVPSFIFKQPAYKQFVSSPKSIAW